MVLYSSLSLSHMYTCPLIFPLFILVMRQPHKMQPIAFSGRETQISKIQIDDKCFLNSPPLLDQWFAIPQSPHRSCDLPKRNNFPLGVHLASPPSHSNHHVLGMPDPLCPWQRGGREKKSLIKRLREYIPSTMRPMVHLSHALHFCHWQ